MTNYSKLTLLAILTFTFVAPALACVGRGYLETDTCNITFDLEQGVANFLSENQAKCGLTGEEVAWLTTNMSIYSKVTKETDEQYKEGLSAIQAQKIKKTPENKAQWEIIDKKNDCGAPRFERKGQFTFKYEEASCLWHNESQTCACANC